MTTRPILASSIVLFSALGGLFSATSAAFAQSETITQSAHVAAGISNGHFGYGCAADGDTLVVGANTDNGGPAAAGSAYVYRSTGGPWTLLQKLSPADATTYDEFGAAVSISGNYLVVGSPMDDDLGSNSGSAYVYRYVSTANPPWVYHQKLLPTSGAAQDFFGCSVAISGDTIFIGAKGRDEMGAGSGAAYVFKFNGSSFVQQTRFLGAASYAEFGTSVAVSNSVALVGAPADGPIGGAYLYRKSGSNWTQEAVLRSSSGGAGDYFGASVAISDSIALVGAFRNGVPAMGLYQCGGVYAFHYTGSSWTAGIRLGASDAASWDNFGSSVALIGTKAVIGAKGDDAGIGSAYVFTSSGTSWSQMQKLVASDRANGDAFGSAVTGNSSTYFVGSPWGDGTVVNSGKTYVYGASAPPPTNTAPTITNVNVVSTTTSSVTLSGSASDQQDGSISHLIRWSYASQPSVTLATGSQVTIQGLAAGTTYSFIAQVTDSGGMSASSSPISATTNSAVCLAPTLTASAGSVTANSATLSGSAFDPNTTTSISSQIKWYASSNPSVLLHTGASYSVSGLSSSTTYSYIARVTNSCGTSANPVTVQFTTSAASCFTPYLSASASNVTSTSASLSGVAYDYNISSYISNQIQWFSASNPTQVLATGASFTPTGLAPGTFHSYIARVTVSCGASATPVTVSFTTTSVLNSPPSVTISSPSNGSTFGFGTVLTFTGSATDQQDGNLTGLLHWSSNIQGTLGTGGTVIRSDLAQGTHTITARSTDSGGLVGTATITITIGGGSAPVDRKPQSEAPIAGTISGNFTFTHSNDSVYQSITEVLSPGGGQNRYSYLEHTWVINVAPGNTKTFHLNAHRPASPDGDNFVFEYSTNGSTFIPMVTVTKTTDDNVFQTFTLPSSLAGNVTIRVKDTNRVKKKLDLDTIYIDQMFIRSQ